MSPTRRSLLVVAPCVTLALASVTALPAAAQKGKPAPPPNAVGSVLLADGPDDEVVSDQAGAYEGATIYGSGVLLLEMSPVAGPSRTMTIRLRNKTLTAGAPVDHVAAADYLTDGVFRIDNLNALPDPSGWGRSTGRLTFGSSLANHVLGFRYATSNGVPVYGTDVCVRRLPVQPATWEVASSERCSADGAAAGLFEEGLKGKGYRWEAVYPVRFFATVTCTSGSTCPQ